MRRRDFLRLSAGVATTAWLPVSAQSSGPRVIGYLSPGSPYERKRSAEAFREGLKEAGYVDGKDVHIEYRWAEGHHERLPELAAELVQRNVAVIVAVDGIASGIAAKAATSTIPILFLG